MNTSSPTSRSGAAFILALAVVVALGPFAIDTYLASLPGISAQFDAPEWATQLTLTGYLVVLGAGQLFAGPLTDALGRRRPMCVGLVLFLLGSVIAAFAPSMLVLVIARLLQGAGGAITVVVSNSAVRDGATGDAATRIFATLMSVGMIAPVIAPVVGGFVDEWAGWRAVFGVLFVFGLIALAVVLVWLPESLPRERRSPLALRSAMRSYASALSSIRFLRPLAGLLTAFFFLFLYLGGASYVYQTHYGLSASSFGLWFGVTALIGLIGPVSGGRLVARIGSARLARWGGLILVAGSAAAVVVAALHLPLVVLVVSLGVGMLGLGYVEPALMGAALSAAEGNAGSAAAVIGASQYLLGALATALAVPLAASALMWTAALAITALAALLLVVSSSRSGGVGKTRTSFSG